MFLLSCFFRSSWILLRIKFIIEEKKSSFFNSWLSSANAVTIGPIFSQKHLLRTPRLRSDKERKYNSCLNENMDLLLNESILFSFLLFQLPKLLVRSSSTHTYAIPRNEKSAAGQRARQLRNRFIDPGYREKYTPLPFVRDTNRANFSIFHSQFVNNWILKNNKFLWIFFSSTMQLLQTLRNYIKSTSVHFCFY